MAMVRLRVMLPARLRRRAMRRAREFGISLSALVRNALEARLKSDRISRSQYPLFADKTVFEVSVPQDSAGRHDDYLYGEERVPVEGRVTPPTPPFEGVGKRARAVRTRRFPPLEKGG